MAIDKKSGYYDEGGIETIDVQKAKLTPEQYKGWLMGNLIKYPCRMNFKDSLIRDVEKIHIYSGELLDTLRSELKEEALEFEREPEPPPVMSIDARDEIGNVCHSCFHQGNKKVCPDCQPNGDGDLPTHFNRRADRICRTCVDHNLINQQCERSLVFMKPLDWCRKHEAAVVPYSKRCGNCAKHEHSSFFCNDKEVTKSSRSYCSDWEGEEFLSCKDCKKYEECSIAGNDVICGIFENKNEPT
jgi:hypothetical protein